MSDQPAQSVGIEVDSNGVIEHLTSRLAEEIRHRAVAEAAVEQFAARQAGMLDEISRMRQELDQLRPKGGPS